VRCTRHCSEEVIGCPQTVVWNFELSGCRVELEEVEFHVLVNFHYGSFIAASVTIIWRGEDSDNVALVRPVVSVHDKLMSARNSHEAIGVIELLADVLAERVASSTWRDTPATSIVGVRPEQVANWAFVRDFLHTVELSNLIECVDGRREPAMKAENSVVNYSCEW
jgi:hypothetical protein